MLLKRILEAKIESQGKGVVVAMELNNPLMAND
jgi:hypothetical protein